MNTVCTQRYFVNRPEIQVGKEGNNSLIAQAIQFAVSLASTVLANLRNFFLIILFYFFFLRFKDILALKEVIPLVLNDAANADWAE